MEVDIVVSTYKRHDLLQEALKSVANQSYPYWKCWIVEDGQSQETCQALKAFLNDSCFFHLSGSHTGLPAVPRNKGIIQGVAPYVAILDDDDLWLPGKLEKQVAFLERHPDCVLLGSNGFRWTGKGTHKNARLYFERKKMFGKINYIDFVNQNYLICSSVMFRRNILEKSGLFNETPSLQPGQDYELWLRIGALGEIWNLAEPLVIYRETPSTHYKKNPDRRNCYKSSANIYLSALKGVQGIPSPLSYPENSRLVAACCRERDFYLAGPRFLGRLMHEMRSNIKQAFNFFREHNS